jgi:phosphatidylinositol phospholipase C, beta
MTKKFEFDWRIPVPEPLLTGCVFDRWTEVKDDKEIEYNCTFKVDEYGFFIYWKSEGKVRQKAHRHIRLGIINI